MSIDESQVQRELAALCDLTFEVVGRYVAGSMRNAIAMEVNRCVLPAALGITEDELRAALASPAPAPQRPEPVCFCGRLGHRLGGPILHKRTEECSR